MCSMQKLILLIQHINSSVASCSGPLPGSLVAAIIPLYSTLYIELVQYVLGSQKSKYSAGHFSRRFASIGWVSSNC